MKKLIISFIAAFSFIAFLLIFNIDIDAYNIGGSFINMFLGPATVILAVPLYRQLENLKKNAVPILVGVFLGSTVSVISVICLSLLFKLNEKVLLSLIPKSITTPIGIGLSSQLGGLVPVTVLAILITGITGAVFAPNICRLFKIKSSVAIGVAIGTSSHALGTTKALQLGETEGAMSGLSIGIAGIMTVITAPFIYRFTVFIMSLFK
jgi:predicted murein hydrolase (TIGR00659 family)